MPREPQRRQTKRRRENDTADQVVADQVKMLRQRRGISQQHLADSLGWTQSAVARLESGKRSISVGELLALGWALDVAPVFLLAGSFQSGDVPVHKTLRVPTRHMLNWIRGGEPLPGANYRAYFENIPDDEWIARFGPIDDQRAAAAFRYEQAEIALDRGVRGSGPELTPEEEDRMADQRATRRKELEATRRAGKKRDDG